MEYRMSISTHANSDPRRIWEVLADFGAFLEWMGDGESEIRMEGEGIGATRHLKMPNYNIAEKLVECDETLQSVAYELVYGEPLGMLKYQARVVVKPAGTSGAELDWVGEFDAASAEAAATIEATLASIYPAMTEALDRYIQP